ncbi:MAG: SusD/RagB family nutrient-binding outer membrane lipoprotein [Flavobacteriaceae bacterium]|jgi:hypothetical protein|nr:SusD/RagB family nutrient-binding outer membrane lipoprotein [Flavobacteriaceae bacterium]
MKKFNHKIFPIIITGLLAANGCTRDFNDINKEYVKGLDEEQLNADYGQLVTAMKLMQKSILGIDLGVYQLTQNLNSDMYSGYFSTPNPFGGPNNLTYFMKDNWNERIMITQLEDVLNRAEIFKSVAAKTYPGYDFTHATAIINIVKVISSLKTSDAHGPVIYSKFNNPNADGSTDFDSQADAYHFFIADLNKSIAVLSNKTLSQEDNSVIKGADIFYNGDTSKWMRFANSLKFRIAMRMSYAAPADAKKYAEEALVSPAGLIESNLDNALLSYNAPSPLGGDIYDWTDCRAGAPLLSYMTSYKDPRITAYADPATDPLLKGQYIGIRNGINLSKNGKSFYVNYSIPKAEAASGAYFTRDNASGKGKFFGASETWFLKAEAALKGYAGAGDAKTNYETAIKTSFEEWGKSADAIAYLQDAISVQQPYIDPKDSGNNIPAGSPMLSTITIKWNDADSNERKLERIMTQKWLALYPDGSEAWAEQRRTGYPILFQNLVNESQGTIDTKLMIRRIPIANKYRNNNPVGYQRALSTLGGPDTGGTKLWWDKK